MNSPQSIPLRTCDIVMKGGTTSGVVYPQAISTLAERFHFKNIGGTSAGAIAAAATAAAEYRRVDGRGDDGFVLLNQLPGYLGEKPGGGPHTRLFGFFQPDTGTARAFDVLTGALEGGADALRTVVSRAARHYAGFAWLGGLPGLLLLAASAAHFESGWIAWLWMATGMVLFLAGALLGAIAGCGLDFIRKVPANGYGLCGGMGDAGNPSASGEPLTRWLTAYLDETAGLPPGSGPLTFSHLWGTRESDAEKESRRVNLEMMTTNLSHGRPYRLPFRDDEDLRENHRFYFRADEFRRLFPEHVVQWMIDHPRPHQDDPKRIGNRAKLLQEGYHPLPAPADLPVIVATRMSLSFPILLSALPLHCIDRSVFQANGQPERCWFSDGGICSNFPLHFFDTALPRRLNFSIDLTRKPDDTPKDLLKADMDPFNGGEISDRWNRFDTAIPTQAGEVPRAKPPLQALGGFLKSMVATMQNWTDATQCPLPGYRDRIVRVPLTSVEGGLNLNMPPGRINDLTERGMGAAELLMERFDVPPTHEIMTWDNHRWIRLRSFLASFEKTLCQLMAACDSPENGDRSYEQWLDDLASTPGKNREKMPGYKMSPSQIEAARKTLALLRSIQQHCQQTSNAKNAPVRDPCCARGRRFDSLGSFEVRGWSTSPCQRHQQNNPGL